MACEQGTERRSGFGFVPRLPSRFERGASNRGFVVPSRESSGKPPALRQSLANVSVTEEEVQCGEAGCCSSQERECGWVVLD